MRTPDPKVKSLLVASSSPGEYLYCQVASAFQSRLFRAVEGIDGDVLAIDVDALIDSYLHVDLDDGRKLNIKDAGKQLKDNENRRCYDLSRCPSEQLFHAQYTSINYWS